MKHVSETSWSANCKVLLVMLFKNIDRLLVHKVEGNSHFCHLGTYFPEQQYSFVERGQPDEKFGHWFAQKVQQSQPNHEDLPWHCSICLYAGYNGEVASA